MWRSPPKYSSQTTEGSGLDAMSVMEPNFINWVNAIFHWLARIPNAMLQFN